MRNKDIITCVRYCCVVRYIHVYMLFTRDVCPVLLFVSYLQTLKQLQLPYITIYYEDMHDDPSQVAIKWQKLFCLGLPPLI
jgi:hypothetical protein